MPAKASQEGLMLLYRLDCEVANYLSITDVLDECGKLTEREFRSIRIATIVSDYHCKGNRNVI